MSPYVWRDERTSNNSLICFFFMAEGELVALGQSYDKSKSDVGLLGHCWKIYDCSA